MNFLKRAYQSLWAKKGRSILLIAVFAAILIFVLAGLTIKSATEVASENAKKSVGATVTLATNRQGMFKTDNDSTTSESEKPDPSSFEMTPVKLSDAKKIAALSGVKSYSFEVSTSADKSSGIEPISSDSEQSSEDSDSEDSANGPAGQMPGGKAQMSQGDFQITGVLESSAYSSFAAGTAKITTGEALTQADENSNNVLIESSLAQANDLTVGDTFKVKDSDDKDVTVKVKGIYETSDSGTSMGMRFNFMNPANTIFTSYTLANELKGSDATDTIDSAVYDLSDPKEMDSFVKEASKLIDTDTYSLQTNDQMYQQMLQPLNNVASFAKNIILLVAVAGVIILTLIVMLTIRERRYEIGVLLSLGESRFKVILQFFSEIFVCMLFALVIATFSGNVVGNAVGNQLLAQQSETTEVATTNMGPGGNAQGEKPDGQTMQAPNGNKEPGMQRGFNNALQTSEAVKELKISVSPTEIASLAAMGLFISMFAILLASVGILRLNPKKILVS